MEHSTELVTTASFNAGKRKFTAVKACQERDAETLLALVNAYLNQKGKKGIDTPTAKARGILVSSQTAPDLEV